MSIKNNDVETFTKIEVVEFSYKKAFKQNPKPSLIYRWQKIHVNADGIRALSDEPVQERHIKDVNRLITENAQAGNLATYDAFNAIQKFIADDLKKITGQDIIFQED